jgi:hypothetical protein
MKSVLAFLVLAAAPAAAAAQVFITDGPTGADEQFVAGTGSYTAHITGLGGATSASWGLGDNPNIPNVVPMTPLPQLVDGPVTFGGLALAAGVRHYAFVIAQYASLPIPAQSDGAWVLSQPIVAPASGVAPLPVDFRLTLPAAANVLGYEWDFDAPFGGDPPFVPDYSSPTSGDAVFLYLTPGVYEARVRVRKYMQTDDEQSFIVTVTAPSNAPTSSLTVVPGPGPYTAPVALTFTVSASSATGISAVLWDFDGDGAPDASSDGAPSITRTITQVGLQTVTVTVIDAEGLASTSSVVVDVTGVVGTSPTITGIQVPSVLLDSGSKFTFVATAGSGGAEPLTEYRWDFEGDGEIDVVSAGPSVNWQLHRPGLFQARLTVLDAEGLTFTAASIQYEVGHNPGNRRCWILAPLEAARVWGNFVSVIAEAVPEEEIVSVLFEYKDDTIAANPWIPIGTSTPADGQLGVHWDVTGLNPAAPYLLRATATFAGPTTAMSAEVGVSVDPVDPTEEEFSGSPFTRLRVSGVPPGVSTLAGITGSISFLLPAGSASSGTYDEWRTERRSENPHPVEATLQGRRFMPNFHRRVGFAGGSTLAKPSRISVYLTQDLSSGFLPDGTNLATAKFQVMRFNPATGRWEPLFGQISDPARGILRASTAATGELAVAVITARPAAASGSDSGCGFLGVEVVLPLAVLFLRRRRACGS